MRQSWDNHETVMRNFTTLPQLQTLQTCLLWSVLTQTLRIEMFLKKNDHGFAFQAKGQCKKIERIYIWVVGCGCNAGLTLMLLLGLWRCSSHMPKLKCNENWNTENWNWNWNKAIIIIMLQTYLKTKKEPIRTEITSQVFRFNCSCLVFFYCVTIMTISLTLFLLSYLQILWVVLLFLERC